MSDNPIIKTWYERLIEAEPEWRNWPPDGGAVNEVGSDYKDDEIADLREALEEARHKLFYAGSICSK